MCIRDRSYTYYKETLEIFKRLEDRWGEALAYHNLGSTASDAGDFATAQSHLQHSIELKTAIGDRYGLALSVIMLANMHLKEQSSKSALPMLAQGLALAVQLGAVPLQINAVAGFGVALAQQARDDMALPVAAFLQTQAVPEATLTHDMIVRLNAILNARYGAALEARLSAQPVPTFTAIIARLTELALEQAES
jgi:tetratricopeptide (TPR) repeat protein